MSEPLILCVQYACFCPPKPFKLLLPSHTQILPLSFGNEKMDSNFQNSDCLSWNESEISKDCHRIQNHFSDTLKHLRKEISRTEQINHLLYQADRRKSQACNTKCINTSRRLKYEFQSLHNFNFSEKEQDDIWKLRSFKKKTNHQVPY